MRSSTRTFIPTHTLSLSFSFTHTHTHTLTHTSFIPLLLQNAKRKAVELEDFGPADEKVDESDASGASGSKRQRAVADVAGKFAELIQTFSPETSDETRIERLRELRRNLSQEIAEAGIAPSLTKTDVPMAVE